MTQPQFTVPESDVLQLHEHLIEVRRHIHSRPEAGADQPETVDYLVQEFADMDVKVQSGAGHVGLVVDIAGERPGATIAMRGDMDALCIREADDPQHLPAALGFRSTRDGLMHACGHDAHTSILVGVAKLVYRNRDRLHGTLRLLFEPGEEGHFGASRMIARGYLDDVDAVFALHCYPVLHVGELAFRKGPFFAAVDTFRVEISGLGGHGSSPETASDQILAASRTIDDLQSIVARRVSPLDSAVLSVCYLSAGQRDSITAIPKTAEFAGSIRTLSPTVQKTVREDFERICNTSIKTVHPACTTRIDYQEVYPVLINNERLVDSITPILSGCVVEGKLHTHYAPILGSDDFAFMSQKVPGVMMLLGTATAGSDLSTQPYVHSPRFDIDERAIVVGVQVLSRIALNYPSG